MIKIFGKDTLERIGSGELQTSVQFKDGKPNYVSLSPTTAPTDSVWIKFDWIAAFEAGVEGHPKEIVEAMGCYVYVYRADPMADFMVMQVDKLPSPMPAYISECDSRLLSNA